MARLPEVIEGAGSQGLPGRGEGSPVTARAVGLGLFFGVGVNLVMLYNDYYIANTPLVLNHLPTVGMAVLLLLMGANIVLRLLGREGLSRGELLLVWGITGLAGGIGATGFWRAVPGFAASPAYLSTPSNEYMTYIVKHLPDWMVVSKDPDAKVLRWYFEGLPRGQSIPWKPWIVPMAAWISFGCAMYLVMFAFTSLFYKRWTVDERLTFPIVYLPLEMTKEPPGGRIVNDFLRNPVLWMGVAVPVFFYLLKGLRLYYPALPNIPNEWWFGSWSNDRPWREFSLQQAGVYFSIVGLTFILTTEVSFSLWFFYVLYRLSFVGVAVMGAAGAGFWGNWYGNMVHFQAAGAAFAMAGFICWSARKALRAWAARVRSGERDAPEDLIPPRATLWLLVLGLGWLVGWVMLAGASWWAALLGIGLFVSVILVLTRLVIEAGLLLTGTEAIAYEFITGLVPASWLSGPTIGTFVQLRGGLMSDLREIVQPYLMNGVRATWIDRGVARKVLGVFAVTIIVAMFSAMYGRISTCYKYGAMIGDSAYNRGWQNGLYPNAVSLQKNPPNYEKVKVGDTGVLPVRLAHTLVGAGVTLALLVLRATFPWWPLSPVGYVVCGSWAMSVMWYSLFWGWLFKWLVMTFGGATAYRKVLPLFLGLILGQAVIAIFWTVVSPLTGRPGILMLPN
jgi:hypothetical protein